MSKDFNDMLMLFSDISLGINSEYKDDINVNEVLNIAKKHSCYHMVALALKRKADLNLSLELKEKVSSEIENQFFWNFSRYIFCSNIFKEFDKNNIKYVCLKGYSVYPLYKNAFYRISSDIDLLVEEKDERKAKKILTDYGFAIEKDRTEYTHHSALIHPTWGLLELHTKMFEDDVTNIWFASKDGILDIDKTPWLIEYEKNSFCVLKPDAQIMQLFFHLVKHFIEGGLSIRAMMDFVLATRKYHTEIDFELVRAQIRDSGMEPIYDAIMSFMVEYCNIDKNSLPNYNQVSDECLSLIYSDLETGAWIGMGNNNNRKAMMEFAEKKRKNLDISQEQTIYKTGFRSKLRILFPHKYHLEKKYPYLKKYSFLYIYVIIIRFIKFIFSNKKKDKKDINDSFSIAKNQNDENRIKMFKDLGLM